MNKRIYKFIAFLMVTMLLMADLAPLENCGPWLAGIAKRLITRTEAATPTYSFLIGNATINDGGEINYSNYADNQRTLKIILRSSEGIASGTAITWTPSNDNIIQIEEQDDSSTSVTLKILSPGYSGLSVSLNINGVVYAAVAYCAIRVPLEWSDNQPTEKNILATASSPYGLKVAQVGETTDNYTLQLYTSNSSDHPNCYHYLRKLRYIDYSFKPGAASAYPDVNGNPATSVPSNVDPNDLAAPATALTWESSDTSVVEVDSLTGLMTAVSAGFARVTVSTNTQNERLGSIDSLSFNVVVVPEGYASGYTTDYLNHFTVITDPKQEEITIQTNAKYANSLSWRLYQGDQATEKNEITSKYTSNIEISDSSGRVVLSGMPAGVYYLTGISQKDSTAARTLATYDVTQANIEYFGAVIIVPFKFPTDELILNYYNDDVYDTYDLMAGSNLPADTFRFSSMDLNVASVGQTDGVVSATGLGETEVIITKISDKNIKAIFGSYAGSGAAVNYDGTNYHVHVSVVNGITLNSTSETLSLGSTFQLALTAPNPYEGVITWKSGDNKVVTVDENGLVTAVGAGDTKVVARIKIGGVTKQAKCKIKVISAVNAIKLNSKNDYVEVGDNLTISAEINPKVNGTKLVWSCSDESIASIADVSELSMTITGVKSGSVVVTAVNPANQIVATKVIKVIDTITALTLSDTEVTLAKTQKIYQLYAYCTPALPSNQTLRWSSSDNRVVTVDSTGKVTLVNPGTAIITCVTENGLIAQCKFIVTQGVTAIVLDETALTLYVGESFRMTYLVKPSNATDSNLKWDTLDSKIATVDATGYITAKNVGTTVITVQSTDGTGIYTMCTVTVKRSATAMKLDVTSLLLDVGDIYQLECTLTPADSTDVVSYETSNSKVATVTKKGKITGKGKGNCVVMAKTASGLTAYVNVEVVQQVTGVKLNTEEATIYVGEELELEATVEPKNASDAEVTWTTGNDKIASVKKDGVVTGVSGGTTIIKAVTVDGDYMSYCIVTVLEKVTEITLQESAEVAVGKKLKLEATVSGETATNKNVTWKSSKTKICTVSDKGVIKGKKPGTCIITVTAADGSGVSAECEVTVFRGTSEINIDPSMSYIEMLVGDTKKIKYDTGDTEPTYSPIWASADTSIAIVSKNGQVTGIKAGTTTVTLTAADDPSVQGTVVVKVSNPVLASSITFDASELIMTVGETKNIVASFSPGNITESYTWTSDNPVVASVDSNGHVVAKQVGTATVTLMTKSGKKSTATVYVVGLSETSVTLHQYEELLLNLEIDGSSRNALNIRWGTSNQNIAVMRNGHVTAKAVGTTTVYAMVNGRKLECKVKVIKNID